MARFRGQGLLGATLGGLLLWSAQVLATPVEIVVEGSVYRFNSSGVAVRQEGGQDVYQVDLNVDTGGYSGGGVALQAVSVKFDWADEVLGLVAAPEGVASWDFSHNELNANGCDGGANDMKGCAEWSAAGLGLGVPAVDLYVWSFEVLAKAGHTLDLGIDTGHVKARYVDDQGNKVGDLVSLDGLITVPAPAVFSLLLLGLPLIWGVARRR